MAVERRVEAGGGGFSRALEERRVLVADGATGTTYQALGLPLGTAPEEWLFEAPERVVEVHRAFVAAGAELILTDTFGATPLRLEHTSLAGRVRDVNVRAVELAREAVPAGTLVAGSMGPTGHLFEPLGPLTRAQCVDNYAQQAGALGEGGADLLVLETFFSLDEALAAVEGTRRASDLPLVVSFSFDQGTRTMMGHSPAEVVEAVAPLGVTAVGANCGRTLADADVVVGELLGAAGGLPVWVKPNAGVPRVVGDAVVYEADPDTLAAHARRYTEQGARVVGGCCGSTPEHVAAVARAVATLEGDAAVYDPRPRVALDER
jgi:5-methyltetrahydrofolate--homocysteine methyltransferase